MSICNNIKPNAPFGCINGGGVYDPIQKKYLWYDRLPDEVNELISCVDANLPEIGIQFNTLSDIYFNKDNPAMQEFRDITGVDNIYCAYEDLCEPLLKIVFAHHDEKQITSLKELLDKHPKAKNYDFIRSEKTLYEILPKGVNKGTVLLKLAELLDINIKKTVAVGDYNNDIAMLKVAGTSFAVSNAVKEVKAVADHITVSNNEHAIAVIIDGIERGLFA
jgi:Cof subfamily protein (haloacid dehalogenase superfamily)